MKKELNEQLKRMQVLAGLITEANENLPRRISAYSNVLQGLYSRDSKKFDNPEIFPNRKDIDELEEIGDAMNALALEYDIPHKTNLDLEDKIQAYGFRDARDNKISKEDVINYIEVATQNSGITKEPVFKRYIDLVKEMKPILASSLDKVDFRKNNPIPDISVDNYMDLPL
jgi:hypothetical protein